MYCGMAFIIYDKEAYFANKEKLKELIITQAENEDNICNASVIEFRDNLYLIFDGHDSLMDWMHPDKELKLLKELHEEMIEEYEEDDEEAPEFVDTRFIHNLLCLTYPEYAKNPDFFYNAFDKIVTWWNEKTDFEVKQHFNKKPLFADAKIARLWKKAEPLFKRENLCFGIRYGEINELCSLMFGLEPEQLKSFTDDIFTATSEQKDVNDVHFIETLYDALEDDDGTDMPYMPHMVNMPDLSNIKTAEDFIKAMLELNRRRDDE